MLAGRKTLSSLDTGQARTYFMEKLTAKRSPRQAPAKGVRSPKGVPEQGEAVALGEQSSLLYQSCNNSAENILPEVSKLSPYHKKQAFCLSDNCKRFIQKVGITHVGFLTLTFPDNVTDNKEASRHFNSMNKHFLSKFFGMWMLAKERQSRGAWHYHILVDCRCDIRTGFDFDAYVLQAQIREDQFKKKVPFSKYRHLVDPLEKQYIKSACPPLRKIWKLLKERLPAYGFGRTELLPIRKEAEAVGLYIGKYISKHIHGREEKDKGVRLVSYSADFPKSTPKLQFLSDGSALFRKNLKTFCLRCGFNEDPDDAFDRLKGVFGPQWAFHLEPYINAADSLTPGEIMRIKSLYRERPGQMQRRDYPVKPRTVLAPIGTEICVNSKTGLFGNGPERVIVDVKTGEILF